MDLIDAVKSAGVVGAGGAGFPTSVKLAAKADCFIVNAAECEPLIETDKYLCRSFPKEIAAGIVRIAGHLGAKRAVIALKKKYVDEISALRTAIDEISADVEIFGMDSFYPAGDEQTMVWQICRVSVPERGIPIDVGAVVSNVGTVLNVERAAQGISVIRKHLSVTGDVAKQLMLDVPVGMPVLECVEAARPRTRPYGVVMGGPMMGRVYAGKSIEALNVTKTTGNILVLPENHYLIQRAKVPMRRLSARAKSVCIRCRMCTDLCPRFLLGHDVMPHHVMRNLWREHLIEDNAEYLKAFGSAVNCCECGICELFSCPMGLSPCTINIYVKERMRERGILPERNLSPVAREGADTLQIPTKRLVARLGLSQFYDRGIDEVLVMNADTVRIPLRQHIGKPALPVKKTGDEVAEGELVAAAAEGISANIHASVTGIVADISDGVIVIKRKAGIRQ